MVFDALLCRGDPRWAVLGVAMRSTQLAEALAEQDGLYSVQVNSAEVRRWQVVGALRGTCVAARDPAFVTAAIAAPSTRWLTLTVTEKGYTPTLAALVVRGLAARFTAGAPGLTIASCDNLSGNGHLLAALCREEAAPDTTLRHWIDRRCAFPDSMVDRIVPASTERHREEAALALGLRDEGALATEAFWEWVIEDRFVEPADADALRSVGVTVVGDVAPFEEAKLRMLNGSHSALACIGAVTGAATVADCLALPGVRSFLHGMLTREVMPALARPQLAEYRDALLARFANPALQHSVHQIASDFSRKIPQRWVPAIAANLRSGAPVEHLAFIVATWVRYCAGHDEAGRGYELVDPLGATLRATAQAHRGDAAGAVRALLGDASIWAEALAGHTAWQALVTRWLERIGAVGVLAALRELESPAIRP